MTVPRKARLYHVFTAGLRDAFSDPMCNCSVRTAVPDTKIGTPPFTEFRPSDFDNSALVSHFIINSHLKASLSWRLEDLCLFWLKLSLLAIGNLVTETTELFCIRCGNVAAIKYFLSWSLAMVRSRAGTVY